MQEKQEVSAKLTNPNVCSDAGAALREMRNWHVALNRAYDLQMQVPEAGVLFTALISIFKDFSQSASCNPFLYAKWIQKFNEIDPNQGGANLTYEDVVAIGNFAYGHLQL